MAVSNSTISVYKNISTAGNIAFDANINYFAGVTPLKICSSDFDGDGRTDIACLFNTAADTAISVLKNTSVGGTVSFAATVKYITGFSHRKDIDAGDLDGDGKVDVLTMDLNSRICVYRNKSNEPIITSFTPTTGTTGTAVTIYGYNFANVSAVQLGSIPVSSYSVNSVNNITAAAAAGETGSVTVTATLGTGFLPGFTYNAPTITSFSPMEGRIGDTVNINGTNFSAIPSSNIVWFGAVKATVIAATTTSLSVKVPYGATYQPMSVIVNNLTAYSSSPFKVVFPSNGFAFGPQMFSPNIAYYPTGGNSNCVYVSDLNSDGKGDLITGLQSQFKISVFKNTTTNNNIRFDPRSDFNINTSLRDIIAGDLNGDGKPEIIASLISQLQIFKNNSNPGGAISFDLSGGLILKLPTGVNPLKLYFADFDKDGRPDIVASISGVNGLIAVFRNMCTPDSLSFAIPAYFQCASYAESVSVADIDGDDNLDIIVSNYSTNGSLTILRNTTSVGAGVLSFSRTDFILGTTAGYVVTGDIDGDNKPDIIVTNPGNNKVSVYKNSSTAGNILLQPKIDYATGNRPIYLCLIDFDGDSKLDIAVSNDNGYSLSLFKNTSAVNAVSFYPQYNYFMNISTTPKALFAADLDADSKPDLVMVSWEGDVYVRKNGVDEYSQIFCPPGGNNSDMNISSFLSGTNYQWQVDTGTGSGFLNIVNNSIYSGVNTPSLRITAPPSFLTGYKYSCKVDGVNSALTVIKCFNFFQGGTSWENPNSWSCKVVPDSNTNVVINWGNVIINSNVTIRTLQVTPGSSVTVNSGYTLTITH